jgi:nitrate reductase NapE component
VFRASRLFLRFWPAAAVTAVGTFGVFVFLVVRALSGLA